MNPAMTDREWAHQEQLEMLKQGINAPTNDEHNPDGETR
jgi:hypothetical protein